jgi:hypothetical protein
MPLIQFQQPRLGSLLLAVVAVLVAVLALVIGRLAEVVAVALSKYFLV